jgi:predicted ATP-dependent protease
MAYKIFFVTIISVFVMNLSLSLANEFKREEIMVINLNHGENSSGSLIVNSLKETRKMTKGLDKALRQIEQVNKNYAKSKGHPDNNYLETNNLKEALETAKLLEKQLQESLTELKASIQQALISN